MQFEYDPERLIEEVKKRPGIWDYNDVHYRSMVTRHELWNEVVHELLDSSVKVSKSELRELVLQLQKKWKGVKDAFLKYVQHPERSKRPYLYYKHLQFLLKNLNPGEVPEAGAAGGGSSESDDGRKKKKKTTRKRKIHIVKDEEQTSDDNYNSCAEAPASFSNDEADNLPLKTSRTSKTSGEFAFANVDSKSIEGEDPDKMFLMSLLPHLKTIPEDDRLNVKLELMQVLQRANYRGNRVIVDMMS